MSHTRSKSNFPQNPLKLVVLLLWSYNASPLHRKGLERKAEVLDNFVSFFVSFFVRSFVEPACEIRKKVRKKFVRNLVEPEVDFILTNFVRKKFSYEFRKKKIGFHKASYAKNCRTQKITMETSYEDFYEFLTNFVRKKLRKKLRSKWRRLLFIFEVEGDDQDRAVQPERHF